MLLLGTDMQHSNSSNAFQSTRRMSEQKLFDKQFLDAEHCMQNLCPSVRYLSCLLVTNNITDSAFNSWEKRFPLRVIVVNQDNYYNICT